MELREWRRLAIQSVTLFVMVILTSVCFRNVFSPTEQKVLAANIPEAVKEPKTEQSQVATSVKQKVEQRAGTYIQIKKNSTQGASSEIKNDAMNYAVSVTFEGITDKDISLKDVFRVNHQVARCGAVSQKETLVKKIKITNEKMSSGKKAVTMRFVLKDVYEPAFYEDEQAYYISLAKPQELYDHIVVIDAGHGGVDEGTCSVDGKYHEKVYTLRISSQIESVLARQGVKVYMTRSKDEWVGKDSRTNFANKVDADLFVSIHCNASSVGDTTAYGIETLYSNRKVQKGDVSNKQLAKIILEEMIKITGQRNRGVIRREQLYLLHHAKVPTTIVEVGYMTNKKDLKLICSERGQEQLAEGICNGIRKALEE